jgi:hypothetical protein
MNGIGRQFKTITVKYLPPHRLQGNFFLGLLFRYPFKHGMIKNLESEQICLQAQPQNSNRQNQKIKPGR